MIYAFLGLVADDGKHERSYHPVKSLQKILQNAGLACSLNGPLQAFGNGEGVGVLLLALLGTRLRNRNFPGTEPGSMGLSHIVANV